MPGHKKIVAVTVTMISGTVHKFEMTAEKALQMVQVITFNRGEEGRTWVDAWDYTEATSGQFVLDVRSIESVYVEHPQPAAGEEG